MKVKYISVVLGLAFVLTGYPQTRTYTLEECIEEAVGNNPGLKSSRKKIEVAQARKGTYLDLPNTGVELSQASIEGAGMDNGLTFSQEFDFPTIYVARHNVLKAEEQLVRQEYNESLAKCRADVTSAYYSLLFYTAKAELLRKDMENYTEFSKISRIRFEAGETSKLECLNAERMLAKMSSMLEETELAAASGRIKLANAIGADGPVDIAENEIYPIDADGETEEFNLESNYSSRVFDAQLKVNEKNISLARHEVLPSFSGSATSQLLLKGFNPYHVERDRFSKGDFMGFSVGVTVPLFFGAKRSQLITAMREAELAKLRFDDEILRQTAEFDELKNELAQSRKRLTYYQTQALGQAAELRNLARISYELGEIDYLEYMQNIENAQEIWIEYFETVERYNQALIKIKTLNGTI